MGYRSEVCIGLTDDATRLLLTIMEHLDENHPAKEMLRETCNDALSDFAENYKTKDADCESKLYWSNTKWYDSYEDVSFMQEFLDQIPDEDYRLVRIGEDTDDCEESGQFHDSDIYISRSISW